MMMTPIRVLVADDHPVVRAGIVGMFTHASRFEIVGMAANGHEAVSETAKHLPDVVLMDVRMPQLGGIDAIRAIMNAHPQTKIIVLTTYDNDHDISAAFEAGAVGYLLKDSPPEVLYEAVSAAMSGETAIGKPMRTWLVSQQKRNVVTGLTAREAEILTLAAQGNTNKAIGVALAISEATVKTHLKHIYAKLEVVDRASAVAVALQRGFIALSD